MVTQLLPTPHPKHCPQWVTLISLRLGNNGIVNSSVLVSILVVYFEHEEGTFIHAHIFKLKNTHILNTYFSIPFRSYQPLRRSKFICPKIISFCFIKIFSKK